METNEAEINLSECEGSMAAAVIELNTLAYPIRSTTQYQHLLPISWS
jgi:hypothetical protein